MKLRKPLAILLTLALSLGMAPLAGADGAVDGQTTFQSTTTITPEMMFASDSGTELPDIVSDTINVSIKNVHDIQVNPYGMSIDVPGSTTTKEDSIVTAPIILENNTGAKVEVTATATAVPEGDVVLDSKPTRYAYEPGPFDDPSEIPSEERVYLYMQITDKVSADDVPDFPEPMEPGEGPDAEPAKETEQQSVITKSGGSSPIKVTMAKEVGSKAALQIFGNTSLPTYYGAWHRGNGFSVNVVLSFMPIREEPGYTVGFDAVSLDWVYEPGMPLAYPVKFLLEEPDTPPPPVPWSWRKATLPPRPVCRTKQSATV